MVVRRKLTQMKIYMWEWFQLQTYIFKYQQSIKANDVLCPCAGIYIVCNANDKRKKWIRDGDEQKNKQKKIIGNVAMGSQIEILLLALQFDTLTETISQFSSQLVSYLLVGCG